MRLYSFSFSLLLALEEESILVIGDDILIDALAEYIAILMNRNGFGDRVVRDGFFSITNDMGNKLEIKMYNNSLFLEKVISDNCKQFGVILYCCKKETDREICEMAILRNNKKGAALDLCQIFSS